MSWVTIVWSGIASACLTLSAMHLLVWTRKRTAWEHLMFSFSAAGVAAYAGCELSMMLARTPEEFGQALRWAQAPTWVLVVSLVGFTQVYLRGRTWLAWTVCVFRTLALLINFLGPAPNVNFQQVTSLQHATLLGDTVSVGVGPRNPLMIFGIVSLVLFAFFVADASLAAWRRGDRRQALTVGGSLVFFTMGATFEAVMVLGGIIAAPLTASALFLGMVLVMGHQLSEEVLGVARLSQALQEGRREVALAEEQFRLVVEASPSGIVLVDGEGLVVLVNAETERLFGYAREELTGKPVEMLVPERFRGAHPGHRAQYLAAPRARAMGLGSDLFARRKDGTEFAADIGLSPIRRKDGPLVLLAITDVSVRKQNEGEVLRLRDDLAHAGRMSTMAQLASSLAHELSQPLGAILRNAEAAELLLQRNPPDLVEVRAILADICKDDHRAGEVIDHMRALLRRRGLERIAIDVAELLTEVLILVQPDATSRKVRISVDVPKELPAARGDRVHLQQVLLNLILNGMDAMVEVPAERRRLAMRARQAEGRAIEVAVTDGGNGVPQAKLERLFEAFFTTKPNGLGLGLPISATIIEAHGGRIWAESSPEGATFYFTIPLSGEP